MVASSLSLSDISAQRCLTLTGSVAPGKAYWGKVCVCGGGGGGEGEGGDHRLDDGRPPAADVTAARRDQHALIQLVPVPRTDLGAQSDGPLAEV